MMSSEYIILPVHRIITVAYIEKGETWSDIEHLILYALCQQTYTSIQLADKSNLPKALVMECILCLMRVGWVEIEELSGRVNFKASTQGKLVVDCDSLPRVPKVKEKKLRFAIDQLIGDVFDISQLNVLNEWEANSFVKKYKNTRVITPMLNKKDQPSWEDIIGTIQDQYERDNNQKIIKFDHDRESFDKECYLKLEKKMNGIVESLSSILKDQIISILDQSTQGKPAIEKPQVLPNSTSWPKRNINLQDEDILIGGPAHLKILTHALNSAQDHVIICSTFLQLDNLNERIALFEVTANRGVRIDLLWDSNRDPKDKRAVKAIHNAEKFRKIIDSKGLGSNIILHDCSTFSHAKILLYNDNHGYRAVVGSCNWFYSNFKPMEISVRFRSPEMVKDCIKVISEMLPSGNQYKKIKQSLMDIRGALYSNKLEVINAEVNLLTVGDHSMMINHACDEAESNIFLTSNRMGNAAENQVLAPLTSTINNNNKINILVRYQMINPNSALGKNPVKKVFLDQYEKNSAIDMKKITKSHAKLLCWDHDHVIITSHNWLSKDDYSKNKIGEVGVYIKKAGIADYIRDSYMKEVDPK